MPEPAANEPKVKDARARAGDRRPGASSALALYGLVRGRNFRGSRALPQELADVERLRYRDLEALVQSVPFELPPVEAARIAAHERLVEAVMRRVSILPAPYGLVFRGRRALVHFLENQYLALDEALSYIDGHWEMRLLVTAPGQPGDRTRAAVLGDRAMHVYAELRRFARAAIPLHDDERILTAAFLVDRSAWIEFVQRSEDLAAAQPDLSFEVTGPWPPYDFVRMTL